MERGKERETHILNDFHEKFISKLGGCQFVDQAFYKQGDMSATLDRIYFDNETDAKVVVEAKSTSQNWLHNQWRVPPSMYLDQVYFQMELSGAKKGFLIWEQPNLDYISVEEVNGDKPYQTWLVSQAEKFVFCVNEQVPFEPDYFEPPYLEKLMNIYGEILEIEESSKRIKKEVMKVFGGETTTDAGVWSFETRPVRSSGFSAPKLREVFAGQEDLLEQCRYGDSVRKEIVFTPNFVDEQEV